MHNETLIPHLFRTEYRKIVAVLCRQFGLQQMEIAEDIASDTFLAAAETWPLKGIPQQPAAWLYQVAKNKTKNYLQRGLLFASKISPEIKSSTAESYEQEIDLSPGNVNDSQLQMMFAVCHPSISKEAQVGLSLRILCGFGIEEIANAFLTGKETINKRLFRAREKLKQENIRIELPSPTEMDARLSAVLTIIYLLFNEGYYSVSQHTTLRKDLCMEAMRLCTMLVENESTNKPAVNALLALMCFHASRFDARINEQGELVLYEEQDTSLWNTDLISKGGYFLHRAASGNQLTKYHLEAGIAYWNTQKEDTPEKWQHILQYYNLLLQIEYAPIAALNRTYALSKVYGKQTGITAAEQLALTGTYFYFALLGELYTGVDNIKAQQHFEKALALAKTPADKNVIQKKMNKLSQTS